MKKYKVISTFLCGVSLFNISMAESTGTMQVGASIKDTCQMNVSSLVIGSVTPGEKVGDSFAASPITNYSGRIELTCTKGTVYKVNLGTGSSGTYTQRTMQGTKPGNTDTLKYNLYSGYSEENVRGDGTNGTDNVGNAYEPVGTGVMTRVFTTIYIPPGQFVTNDQYVDTIPITLTY